MHKVVVNPQILRNFKTTQDQVEGKVSHEYEEWIMQDQVIFIWLLYSEVVLPQVLPCKHVFEVWDRIHKYFNAHMKARVYQLRVELKSIKKGNSYITEFVMHVKAIVNSLLVVGDIISEQIPFLLDSPRSIIRFL